MNRLVFFRVLPMCSLAVSCGTPASGPELDANGCPPRRVPTGVFVAVGSDFCGFHSWKSFDVTDGAALAGIHDGSTVTEYLNAAPPKGSRVFPVGTIVVKEATGGTIPHELFAMVKRGGGFNTGAPGWEWFELQELETGDTTKIVWRGFGPPSGETYGGDVNAGCNTCHTACNNDDVCAKPLALTNF